MLLWTYETMYGIYDHDNDPDKNPLALVTLHPKEDVSEYSELYRTINRFAIHKIHEQFGVSLVEFLNLPRDYVQLLFRISTDTAEANQKPIDEAMRKLAEEQRKSK